MRVVSLAAIWDVQQPVAGDKAPVAPDQLELPDVRLVESVRAERAAQRVAAGMRRDLYRRETPDSDELVGDRVRRGEQRQLPLADEQRWRVTDVSQRTSADRAR
jgi:hypothetical protein